MNASVYILITTELGTAGDIVEALQQIAVVTRAGIATGTYNAGAIVEVHQCPTGIVKITGSLQGGVCNTERRKEFWP